MDNYIIWETVQKNKFSMDMLHEWTNAKQTSKPTYI
jgi:hypothetical protein